LFLLVNAILQEELVQYVDIYTLQNQKKLWDSPCI